MEVARRMAKTSQLRRSSVCICAEFFFFFFFLLFCFLVFLFLFAKKQQLVSSDDSGYLHYQHQWKGSSHSLLRRIQSISKNAFLLFLFSFGLKFFSPFKEP